MIGAVGDDDAGRNALNALRAAGVRTHFVDIVDRPMALNFSVTEDIDGGLQFIVLPMEIEGS